MKALVKVFLVGAMGLSQTACSLSGLLGSMLRTAPDASQVPIGVTRLQSTSDAQVQAQNFAVTSALRAMTTQPAAAAANRVPAAAPAQSGVSTQSISNSIVRSQSVVKTQSVQSSGRPQAPGGALAAR